MSGSWFSRSVLIVFSVLLLTGLAACAHQPAVQAYNPPGLLSGLLHGFLIFFSAVGSIFLDIRIYAFPNSGFWYDIGYATGAFAAGFCTLGVLMNAAAG
jgi:hypothetical protein